MTHRSSAYAQAQKLSSEAGYRFSRGIHPALAPEAVRIVVGLLAGALGCQRESPPPPWSPDQFDGGRAFQHVANLVAIATVRELGPIMTSIILAGRTGAAFAAHLGTMQVREEIDALITMGLDPVRFLVVTRVIAAVLMTPLLTIFSDLVGLVGGAITMQSFAIPFSTFLKEVDSAVTMTDFLAGFDVCVASVGSTLTAALAVPAAAAQRVPFKGSMQGIDVDEFLSSTTVLVTTTGTGIGTHLGQFSFTQQVTVNLTAATSAGSAHWVAANGDSIDSTSVVSAVPGPVVYTVTEIHAITGGTGRFSGAQGSFTVHRTHVVAPSDDGTHVTFGWFEGTITSPGAAH